MDMTLKTQNVSFTVTRFSWERIYLFFDIQVNPACSPDSFPTFYAVDASGKAIAPCEVVSRSENSVRLRLNITNTGENRCFPNGTVQFWACMDGVPATVVTAQPGLSEEMDGISRVFLYESRHSVYTVSFSITDHNPPVLQMHTMAAAQKPVGAPLLPEKNPSPSRLVSIRRKGMRAVYGFFCRLYHHRREKHPGVLFMTEQGTSCNANQMAVCQRMQERGLRKDFEIMLSARPAASQHQPLKSWFSLLRKIAKSRYVFLDDHAPVFDWLKVDSGTCLIQLWHAGAGFKSAGYSRWGHSGCPAPQGCHRQYTYGIAGSRRIAPFFSEAWGISPEQVLPTGMPRMDKFLEPEHRAAVTASLLGRYPLCRNKKVILFAPTYRGKGRGDAHYPYEQIDFDKLYRLCSEDYVVLFKMHPWVHDPVPIPPAYRERMADVGDYPDINDLFYITDLLITDYSSNIFEFSLMGKPMLFFAFDEASYAVSRGFHRNYRETAPGKICRTFEEVLSAIAHGDFEQEKVEEYVQLHFDHTDSHASDRVIDWILLKNMPESLRQAQQNRQNNLKKMKALSFPPAGN